MNSNRALVITNFILLGLVMNLGMTQNTDPASGASGSLISACANKTTGALRLSNKCLKTETAISWNQQGPTGPQGIAGPKGPIGVGIQGPVGPQGPAGTPAIAATQDITIRYLASGVLGCSIGRDTLFDGGYIYPWLSGSSIEVGNSLSNAMNWKKVYQCTATIKVVK